MGINPDPLTLRELAWMAEGNQSAAWDHTSCLRADMANQWRKRGTPASRPDDFHPYRKRERRRDVDEFADGKQVKKLFGF